MAPPLKTYTRSTARAHVQPSNIKLEVLINLSSGYMIKINHLYWSVAKWQRPHETHTHNSYDQPSNIEFLILILIHYLHIQSFKSFNLAKWQKNGENNITCGTRNTKESRGRLFLKRSGDFFGKYLEFHLQIDQVFV